MDTIILSDDSDEEVIVTSVKIKGRSVTIDSSDGEEEDIIFVASSKAKLNRQGNATVVLSVPPGQSDDVTSNGEQSAASQDSQLLSLQLLDIEPTNSSLPNLDVENLGLEVGQNTTNDGLINASVSNEDAAETIRHTLTDTHDASKINPIFLVDKKTHKNFPVSTSQKYQAKSDDQLKKSADCDVGKGHNFICQNLGLTKHPQAESQTKEDHSQAKEYPAKQEAHDEETPSVSSLVQGYTSQTDQLDTHNQAGNLKLRIKRCYSVQAEGEEQEEDRDGNRKSWDQPQYRRTQSLALPSTADISAAHSSSVFVPSNPADLQQNVAAQSGVSVHQYTSQTNVYNTGAISSSNKQYGDRSSKFNKSNSDFIFTTHSRASANSDKSTIKAQLSSLSSGFDDVYTSSSISPIPMPDIHYVGHGNSSSKSKPTDDSDLELPNLSFGRFDKSKSPQADSSTLSSDKVKKEKSNEFKTIFAGDLFSSDTDEGDNVPNTMEGQLGNFMSKSKSAAHRSHRRKHFIKGNDSWKRPDKIDTASLNSSKNITVEYKKHKLQKKFKCHLPDKHSKISSLTLSKSKGLAASSSKPDNSLVDLDEHDTLIKRYRNKYKHSKHSKHKDKGKRLRPKGLPIDQQSLRVVSHGLSDSDDNVQITTPTQQQMDIDAVSFLVKDNNKGNAMKKDEESDVVILKALPGRQGKEYTIIKKEKNDIYGQGSSSSATNLSNSHMNLLKPINFDLMYAATGHGSSSINSTTGSYGTGSAMQPTPHFLCNPPKCPAQKPHKPKVDMGALLYGSSDEDEDIFSSHSSNVARAASKPSLVSSSTVQTRVSSNSTVDASRLSGNAVSTLLVTANKADNSSIPYKKRKVSLIDYSEIKNAISASRSLGSYHTSSNNTAVSLTSSVFQPITSSNARSYSPIFPSQYTVGSHLEEKTCYYCAMQKAKLLLSSCTKGHFCCGTCLEDHAKDVLLGKKVKPPTAANVVKTDDDAVNRCAKFLTTLHRLSLSGTYNANNDVNLKVADSIQDLINGTQDPMQFMFTVQGILHGKNQPNLVAFLKKALPMLQCKLFLGHITLDGYRPPPMRAIDLTLMSHVSPGNTESKSTSSWSLQCRYPGCNSYFPMSELRKTLPSMVVDMLEEKLDQSFLDFMSDELMKSTDSSSSNNTEAAATDQAGPSSSGAEDTSSNQGTDEVKPVVITPIVTAETQEDSNRNSSDLPDHWEPMDENKDYEVFSLNPESEEYLVLAAMFHDTMYFPNSEIMGIKRVQNPMLWRYYQLKKAKVVKENPDIEVEKKLFHGTKKDVIEAICRENFDWRICGQNGTAYGQGSYFARDASYSHRYALETGYLTSSARANRGRASALATAAKIRQAIGHYSRTNTPSNPKNSFRATINSLQRQLNLGHLLPPHYVTPSLASSQPNVPNIPAMPVPPPPYNPYLIPTPVAIASAPSSSAMVGSSTSSGAGSSGGGNNAVSSSSSTGPPGMPIPGWSSLLGTPLNLSQSGQLFSFHGGLQPSTSLLPTTLNPTSDSTDEGSSRRTMFVARVLTGNFTHGSPSFKRPPPIDVNDRYGKMFDSCVDNLNNPQVFVVFEHQQCYPEYLLEYKNRGGLIG